MATLGTTALTYADWAKRTEEYGIAAIVELLSQTNEILLDMMVVEGNLPTGHKTTVRTGLSHRNVAPAQLRRPEREVHDGADHRHLRQLGNLFGHRQRHR
jgi:hypothetical protein